MFAGLGKKIQQRLEYIYSLDHCNALTSNLLVHLCSLELHSVYLVINALFLVIHGAYLRKLTSSQGFGFFAPSAARHRLVNFEHHTVPGRFSLVGQLLRNCLKTYLSVFSSSGTKSLRLARTSYFSLSGFFLLSLYLPGSSIPVSAIGQIMNVSEFEKGLAPFTYTVKL